MEQLLAQYMPELGQIGLLLVLVFRMGRVLSKLEHFEDRIFKLEMMEEGYNYAKNQRSSTVSI